MCSLSSTTVSAPKAAAASLSLCRASLAAFSGSKKRAPLAVIGPSFMHDGGSELFVD
ncbi:MAG: hypothetical protein M0T84_11255 [Betaproteobacteria bacterium]|nr:hypothetical protein [Betaproteobacteria bacterium]